MHEEMQRAPYSEVWSFSRLTCVKSLAPATSTNITLLQSINTAWTSLSDVSTEKQKGKENFILNYLQYMSPNKCK